LLCEREFPRDGKLSIVRSNYFLCSGKKISEEEPFGVPDNRGTLYFSLFSPSLPSRREIGPDEQANERWIEGLTKKNRLIEREREREGGRRGRLNEEEAREEG